MDLNIIANQKIVGGDNWQGLENKLVAEKI